ncbi:hypothetical protein LINGRAHAP2_LOCUS2457 [Linum grandiflorum]
MSGQEVSREKSRIYFSKNVSHTLASNICQVLGMSKTETLGRYLGIPMIHGRGGVNHYRYILERLDSKLSG